MEEFFKLVGNFGFPIVVSGYFMVRLEKKMDDVHNLVGGKDGILDKLEEVLRTVQNCKRK
jgi:hypothetical protein